MSFRIGNGTRQGGVISPYLFARYIRKLLGSVRNTGIGCFVGNVCMNILAYADDIVVLAPSWHALQTLLNVLHSQSILIDMCCNVNKTVCMMFKPKRHSSIIRSQFPSLRIGASCVQYVSNFKYLGHVIMDNLSDDADIHREIRCMFTRCNMLRRRFYNCSMCVKLALFKSFCLGFYNIALWNRFRSGWLSKFRSCYIKCAKMFLRFNKFYSVTNMLLLTGLPSFDTLMNNARKSDVARWNTCSNALVKALRAV